MEGDAKLIERVLAGDKESFRPLVERYKDAVFGVALSRTGHFADAEEIAQDTFLAAFHRLGQLKDRQAFGAWICSIARNRAAMHLRSRRTQAAAQDRLAEAARRHEAGERDRPHHTQELVRAALERLSPLRGEVTTLYYINGYSVAQVSQFVGRPQGTVKRRLHEARNQLRKELLAMMEGTLKTSRPGREFTDTVARRITQTRVWVSGGRKNYLLLRDDRGRCSAFFLGLTEAQEIRRCLRGKAVRGIHGALMALLKALGYQVREVALRPSPNRPNTCVRLHLQGGRGRYQTVEAEYCVRDAIQLAVHTGAPMMLEGDSAKNVMKDKHGKPLAPQAAWRSITASKRHAFRNVPEVIRELEKNPDSDKARRAVGEFSGRIIESPFIEDAANGWATFRQWFRRCRGTPREALANALMGGLYMLPPAKLRKAAGYLRKAHTLRPDDETIAFDLATAYARTGRRQDALRLIEKFRFKDATTCHNFEPLWKDRRFLQAVGKPRPPVAQGQFAIIKQVSSRMLAAGGLFDRIRRATGHGGPRTAPAAKAGALLRQRVQQVLGAEGLAEVAAFAGPRIYKGLARVRFWLVLAGGAVACLDQDSREGFDRRFDDINNAMRSEAAPWKTATDGAQQVLNACDIRSLAVVLVDKLEEGFLAELVARHDGRTAHVGVDGIDALLLAIRHKLPVLMAEKLRQELTVRGKTGRPLTLAGALRQFPAKNGR